MTTDDGRVDCAMAQGDIGFRAFTDIERPDPELVRRLAAYAPPDLSDAMQGGYTIVPAIRPLYSFAQRIAGPAVTVAVPRGANDIVRFAIDHATRGDVLVVKGADP